MKDCAAPFRKACLIENELLFHRNNSAGSDRERTKIAAAGSTPLRDVFFYNAAMPITVGTLGKLLSLHTAIEMSCFLSRVLNSF